MSRLKLKSRSRFFKNRQLSRHCILSLFTFTFSSLPPSSINNQIKIPLYTKQNANRSRRAGSNNNTVIIFFSSVVTKFFCAAVEKKTENRYHQWCWERSVKFYWWVCVLYIKFLPVFISFKVRPRRTCRIPLLYCK